MNKRNCRIWASEHPRQVIAVPHGTVSFMIWCTISKKCVVETHFLENKSVTADSYKKMLRYFLFPKLRGYAQSLIFQQDGAPPHHAHVVLNHLDQKLRTRWTGKYVSTTWQTRSPHLSPCNFSLWEYIKDRIYLDLPISIEEMKTKFREHVSSNFEDTLRNVVKTMNFIYTCFSGK